LPVERRVVPKKKPGPGWWTQQQKYEAVAAYLALGNVRLVVATTGVPEDTLRKWKAASWWKDAEDELRRSSKIELSGKLKKALDKALPALEDRIENGDFYYNIRTRQLERKPLPATTLVKATAVLLDRQMIVDKASQETKQTDEGLADRLANLAREMARFAKAKTIDGELVPTQGEIIDVVPAEDQVVLPELI
jgi:hypothetical protein